MQIYVFKSDTRHNLYAFADDIEGIKLPEKFGPWRLMTAPHLGSLPQDVPPALLKEAIIRSGFQLFRMKANPAVRAAQA